MRSKNSNHNRIKKKSKVYPKFSPFYNISKLVPLIAILIGGGGILSIFTFYNNYKELNSPRFSLSQFSINPSSEIIINAANDASKKLKNNLNIAIDGFFIQQAAQRVVIGEDEFWVINLSSRKLPDIIKIDGYHTIQIAHKGKKYCDSLKIVFDSKTPISLIHIGDSLPEHFWTCLKQARKYFEGKITAIVPKSIDDYAWSNTEFISWEDLAEDTIYKEMDQACFLNGFWKVTLMRLALLEIIMRRYNMTDVVHIENDVLLFQRPELMLEAFRKQAHNSVALTPIGKDYITAAYCFVPHIEAISKLNTIMKSLLVMGEEELKRRTSGQPVNEMTLLAFIYKEYRYVIKHLPIQPIGKAAGGITPFNSVFDPATYGQHLDGIPGKPGEPLYDLERHWLAPDLKSGKKKIEWILKVPWLVAGSKKYRINNIHVHSKRLEKFV